MWLCAAGGLVGGFRTRGGSGAGRPAAGDRGGHHLRLRAPHQLAFVVPCTATDRQLPFHPQVTASERPTFAMCDQLKFVSRERLRRRHSARLPSVDVAAIKFVLRQLIDTR